MHDPNEDYSLPYDRFEEERFGSNPTVYWKARRFKLGCGCCPPNRGENQRRSAPWDRYKSARKGRCNGPTEPPAREGNFSYPRHKLNPDKPVQRWFRYRHRTKRWFVRQQLGFDY